MKQNKKVSWSRILRTILALTLAMAMLLCAGCGKQDDQQPTTNPNAMGDGDGKLEAQDLVSGFTKIYGTLLQSLGGKTAASSGAKMEMAVTMGDDIRSYLSSMLETQGLSGDISWLQEINLGMEMHYSEGRIQEIISLGLSGKHILSGVLMNDTMNNTIYMGVPELNEQYLGVSLEGMSNMATGMAAQYTELLGALPTEEALNTLLTRYLNIALEVLEDPTTAEETLSHGGISQKVTATTHNILADQLMEMAERALNTVQTDAELEKMLDAISQYANEQGRQEAEELGTTWYDVDLYQQLLDEIPEALENIANQKESLNENDYMRITVYDADGKTVGLRVQIQDGHEKESLYGYCIASGDQTALVVNVNDTLRFEGTGTNKKNILNGKYTLFNEEMEVAYVQVVDFNASELAKGNLEGKLKLSLSNDAIEEAIGPSALLTSATVLEIVMDTEETKSSLELNLYSGSAFIVGVSLQTETMSAGGIVLPSQYVDMTDANQLQQWSENIQYATVLQNLRNAGVPEELVAILEENLEGLQ